MARKTLLFQLTFLILAWVSKSQAIDVQYMIKQDNDKIVAGCREHIKNDKLLGREGGIRYRTTEDFYARGRASGDMGYCLGVIEAIAITAGNHGGPDKMLCVPPFNGPFPFIQAMEIVADEWERTSKMDPPYDNFLQFANRVLHERWQCHPK